MHAHVAASSSIYFTRPSSGAFFFAPLFSPSPCGSALDITQLAQQIAALVWENAQGSKFRARLLGDVERPLGIQPRGDRGVAWNNSTAHLQFFTMSLDFAVFPHAPRRPDAESLGVKSKLGLWKWAAQQVQDFLQDSDWRHAALIDNINVAPSKVFQRVGRRQ